MRRGVVLAGALLAASAIVGLAAAPAAASTPVAQCACGALIGAAGALPSPATRAVIAWDDGVETIDLAVTARGLDRTVGLIVPTPARATVTAGDPALFSMLDRAIRPQEIVEDDWWGRSGDPESVATPEPVAAGVAATRARAGDAKAVSSWAAKNGLSVDAETTKALAGYARNGWSLSLVTLTAPAGDGELAPVRLTFSSRLRVYPLLLAAGSDQPTALRLYLPGEHRSALVQHTRAALSLDAAESVAWAGRTAGGPAASLAPYLTVFDVYLDSPKTQVVADLRVVDAASDDSALPRRLVVHPITLLGFPLGWVLVIWGGLGLVIGVVALAARLRAR